MNNEVKYLIFMVDYDGSWYFRTCLKSHATHYMIVEENYCGVIRQMPDVKTAEFVKTHNPKAVEAGLRDAADACTDEQAALRMRLRIAADTLKQVADDREKLLSILEKAILDEICRCEFLPSPRNEESDDLCSRCRAIKIISAMKSRS